MTNTKYKMHKYCEPNALGDKDLTIIYNLKSKHNNEKNYEIKFIKNKN